MLDRDLAAPGGMMPLPALPDGRQNSVHAVSHAIFPRQLIIYDHDHGWSACTNENVLVRTKYLAISYCESDFTDRRALVEVVRATCHREGFAAYWLDFECRGATETEINQDLYRIADVFRGADKTLCMIKQTPNGWRNWGGRVWTMPEALLSKALLYKVGSDPVQSIELRQVANIAYTALDEEMAIINGFSSGKDPLQRIERLAMLKKAIWRRKNTSDSDGMSAVTIPPSGANSDPKHYPAEKVYALMGFFEHRIMPNRHETQLQALARLSLANDSDRFAERMVSMLPANITVTACWYADEDLFGSNLWDIEPEVQVAGISDSGALVLDGCRAAAIRWKNFPDVAFAYKSTLKRKACLITPYVSAYMLLFGCIFIAFTKPGGATLITLALILLFVSPKLVAYSTTGRIAITQPWLIGVKGILTADDVSERLYGGRPGSGDYSRVRYSPTGSLLAVPAQGLFRDGSPSETTRNAIEQYNLLSRQGMSSQGSYSVYTLVDTGSNMLYYFAAERPPTVCVYTGREGGLGRFILCSETCDKNELHKVSRVLLYRVRRQGLTVSKESVLRMPNYIGQKMNATDWLAIGGIGHQSEFGSCV